MMLRPLRKLLAWGMISFLAAVTVAAAADLGEYQVKAGFLFNFAKFTEWPDSARS